MTLPLLALPILLAANVSDLSFYGPIGARHVSLGLGPSLSADERHTPAGADVHLSLLTGGEPGWELGLEGGAAFFLLPHDAACVSPPCRIDAAVAARVMPLLRVGSTQGVRPYGFVGIGLGWLSSPRPDLEAPAARGLGPSFGLGGGLRPWRVGTRSTLGLEARAQATFGGGEGLVAGTLALALDLE